MGRWVISYPTSSRRRPQIIWNYHQPSCNPIPQQFFDLLSHVARGFSSTHYEDSSIVFERILELANVKYGSGEFQVFPDDPRRVGCGEGCVHCVKNVTV